jgi:hypothetical protein
MVVTCIATSNAAIHRLHSTKLNWEVKEKRKQEHFPLLIQTTKNL